jgi:uncharacterized protein (TIGR00661 family)
MSKPKVLYAIQATGNGHISRAAELIPFFKESFDLDLFISGDNYSISLNHEIKYRSKGLSLRWKNCGEIDLWNTLKLIEPSRLKKEILELPVENYDLVINDFEYIASRACISKGTPTIHIGHQASFNSPLSPRPNKRSIVGEMILKKYAPLKNYIGFHFKSYDTHIYSPIIRADIRYSKSSDQGHITCYLPGIENRCIEKTLLELSPLEFHVFTSEVLIPTQVKNIFYYPPSAKHFSASLIHSSGVITGGGFETPAEALYLNKKLISLPLRGHYEQQCNAAALKQLGVTTLQNVNQLNPDLIHIWYNDANKAEKVNATSVYSISDIILQNLNTTTIKDDYDLAWT